MKVLIICQSLKYVKDAYAKIRYEQSIGNDVYIIVREVLAAYKIVLKIFPLSELDVMFAPTFKQNNMKNILNNRMVIVESLKWIENKGIEICYLFTNECDYISASIVNKSSFEVSIKDYKYNLNCSAMSSLPKILLEFACYGVFSYKNTVFNNYKIKNTLPFEIGSENFDIPKLPLNLKPKNIVIIDSNDELNPMLKGADIILNELIKLAGKSNLNVYVKGHPRLGVSECLLGSENVQVLSFDFPIEFLDFSSADLIVGFYSTALTTVNCTNVVSLIKLINNKSITQEKYLLDNGFSSSKMVRNLKCLEKLITDI